MKPISGNFAENAIGCGVAGLNIDACRIETVEVLKGGSGGLLSHVRDHKPYAEENGYEPSKAGRWPANLILEGIDEVKKMFPESESGGSKTEKPRQSGNFGLYEGGLKRRMITPRFDSGSASRFFKQVNSVERDLI